MNLEIAPEQLRELVVGAVLEKITTEQRDAILQKAILHLITPVKPAWSNKESSPLEDAFQDGVRKILYKVIEEEVSQNEMLRKRLEELVQKVSSQLVECSSEADSFYEALGAEIGKRMVERFVMIKQGRG